MPVPWWVGNDKLCPFCRAPAPSSDNEAIERVMKRVDLGDAQGMNGLGFNYAEGTYGLPQDRDKSLELWHQSAELGYAASYRNVGNAYYGGRGVVRNENKAQQYFELAAMGGNVYARHNLGCDDGSAGNIERALKHFMIAAGDGLNTSLKRIQQMCKDGYATRDDYAKALQAYQAYLDEIKSDDRDKAAAYIDRFKYYE